MGLVPSTRLKAILGFRQDAWVASLHHNERESLELVEIFRTLRVLNLSVWRLIAPEDLQRSGQHNERGAESLAVMLQLLAGHDPFPPVSDQSLYSSPWVAGLALPRPHAVESPTWSAWGRVVGNPESSHHFWLLTDLRSHARVITEF